MIEAGIEFAFRQDSGIRLDVTLACAPAELVALVGPSGSGKSTVLRSIAGLHRPQTGSVRCNGVVWLDTAARIDLPPHRRRVGLVFQNYALFPHLTALDNVLVALAHRPANEREARARALLELVHLQAFAGRLPAQLSGGQQQRVAVARALAREPDVLLLDEPFSAVDRVTRRKLYRELAELRARLEMPTLLVTHDYDEAARLADRICLIADGRGLQTGTPAEVLAHPVSVEAARLVDLQNLFDGVVIEQRADATVFDWHGRRLEAPVHARFAPGTRIAWAVPSTQVILLRAGQRAGQPGVAEGARFAGYIDEMVALSESTSIAVRLVGPDRPRIALTVPARFARSAELTVGRPVEVMLLTAGIHVMPASPDVDGID